MTKKLLTKILLIFLVLVVFAAMFVACTKNNDKPAADDATEKIVTAVAVNQETIPTTAYAGKVHLQQIKLVVTYDDESVEEIGLSEEYIAVGSRNKLSKIGTQKIDVIYCGCMTSFQIVLLNPETVQYNLTVYGGVPISIDGESVTAEMVNGVFTGKYPNGTVVVIEWVAENGKIFGSWESGGKIIDTQSRTTVIMNNNYEYTASSEDLVYTVAFVTYKDDINIAAKTTKYIMSANEITALTMDDYVFVGWTTEVIDRTEALSGNSHELVGFPYKVEENATFYAVWMPIGLSYTTYTDPQTNITGYKVVDYSGALTELEIPSMYSGLPVLGISKDAFSTANAKNITKIIIPSSITNIEDGTFRNCSALQAFSVSTASKKFSSEKGVLYMTDKTILVAYPSNKVAASYELEANVTKICEYAFYNAVVGKIIMSRDVSTIGNYAFNSIHIDCIDFSRLNAQKLNRLAAIGTNLFSDKLTAIYIPSQSEKNEYTAYPQFAAISDKIVSEEGDLDKIFTYQYSEGISVLYRLIMGEYFVNTNRTAEIIGITRNISEINIPDSFTNGTNTYSVSSIGYYAFKDCLKLTSVSLPTKLERVCDKAFDDTPWANGLLNHSIIANNVLYKYLGNDNEYMLPTEITKIAEGAFNNNVTIKFVNLSSNTALTNIAAYAFVNCVNLRSFNNTDNNDVFLKNNLQSVGEYAFFNTAVKTISTQSETGSLKTVKAYAFSECHYLQQADVLVDGIQEISNLAFMCDYSLLAINVSNFSDVYVSYDGILYKKEEGTITTLYTYPAGKLTTEFNPNKPTSDVTLNITTIGEYALCYSNICALEIDNTILRISSSAIKIDGLVYVVFTDNPANNNITYQSAFRETGAEYYVFDDSKVTESSVKDFFGGVEELKLRLACWEKPCVFYIDDNDGNIVYATFSDGKLAVVAADRISTSLTVKDEIKFGEITYTDKTIKKYCFGGYYLTELTLSGSVCELEDNALGLAYALKKLIINETEINAIPEIQENSLGDNFNNGLLIYVNIDPELSGGYLDKWSEFIEIFNYFNTLNENCRASKYIIYKQPIAVLTYLTDENVTRTIKIIDEKIVPTDLADLTVQKNGYDIGGWTDKEGTQILIGNGYDIPYNMVLECSWEAQKYTVLFDVPNGITLNFTATFVSQDEDSTIYSVDVVFGDDYDFGVKDSESKTYEFKGWICDDFNIMPTGTWTTVVNGGTVTLLPNRTLRKYILTYDTGDKLVTMPENSATQEEVHYGEPYELAVPTKSGYEFIGWYTVINNKTIGLTYNDGKSKQYWSIELENVIVYPSWKALDIEVTLMLDENTIYKKVNVKYGSDDFVLGIDTSIISDKIISDKIDLFAGWHDENSVVYTDSDGKAIIAWDKAQAATLYAIWPIEIETAEDLMSELNKDMGASVVLSQDLVLTSVIGSETMPYTGVFNGRGHKVTYVCEQISNSSWNGKTGLFAYNLGTIKNLTFEVSAEIAITNDFIGDVKIGTLCCINEGIIESVNVNLNKFKLTFGETIAAQSVCIGGVVGENKGTISQIVLSVEDFMVTENGGKPYNGGKTVGVLAGINKGTASGSCTYYSSTYTYYDDDTAKAKEYYNNGNWSEELKTIFFVLSGNEMVQVDKNDTFDADATYYKKVITENDYFANKNMLCGNNSGDCSYVTFSSGSNND